MQDNSGRMVAGVHESAKTSKFDFEEKGVEA